jgi:hypothetical protein
MGVLFQDRLADWIVGRKITLTLNLSRDPHTDKRLNATDWVWQMTDLSSRQRDCPTLTSLQLSDSNVAYLGHARTVTLKQAPAITEQQTKRCFLRAEPSRAEPSWADPIPAESRSYKHLDDARPGKGHVTAPAVTQQLKRFPTCQINGL